MLINFLRMASRNSYSVSEGPVTIALRKKLADFFQV